MTSQSPRLAQPFRPSLLSWLLILTLTLNPAVDTNYSVDRLVFEDSAYILAASHSAGGRGINASSVIHAFGGATEAVATIGGEAGAAFENLLKDRGFPVHLVRIQSEIRRNLTITDLQGLAVKLNERGPQLRPQDWECVARTVESSLGAASWLMLCGSLPPGVPASFYSRLIAKAKARGVQTLVDTDGEALAEALEAGPTVVAPNQPEAERLLSRALLTRAHYLEAAERIRSMGAASVVLSLGNRGAVGAGPEALVEVLPPRVDAVCPIGAGDALAAAFTWAMSGSADFADAVRWGVAAGTATARLPGLTFASLAQTEEIYRRVELRPVR